MKKLLHILKHPHSLDQYESSYALNQFIDSYNIDGFEIICCGEENSGKIANDKIIGYHLCFYSYWIDMWNFNPSRLIKEFGDYKTCLDFYGVNLDEFTSLFPNFDWSSPKKSSELFFKVQDYIRSHIVAYFKKDCDHAKLLDAEYVVFHVSNVSTYETFTYIPENSDETIIDASIGIINQLLDNNNYNFEFLLENLWWSGLNFLNPINTLRLFNGIKYHKKGFVLDTGHLLNTNINLESETDAIAYLNNIIDDHQKHFDLISNIKAIHLHQSLTGKYVKESFKNIPDSIKTNSNLPFYEKFSILYKHVLQIDTHRPITFNGTLEFINKVNPNYLIFEITESNSQKLKSLLDLQMSIFQRRI